MRYTNPRLLYLLYCRYTYFRDNEIEMQLTAGASQLNVRLNFELHQASNPIYNPLRIRKSIVCGLA